MLYICNTVGPIEIWVNNFLNKHVIEQCIIGGQVDCKKFNYMKVLSVINTTRALKVQNPRTVSL